MLGEFGSTLADPKDRVWLSTLMAYLGTGVNGMSFTYWSWNPNSGDTGGIALDDWTTINTAKQAILQPYLIAPTGGGGPTTGPRRPRPTTGPTTPPPGGCDATYRSVNTWQGGFQGEVTVTNTGGGALNPWRATWTWPAGMTLASGWNATVTQTGTTVTAAAPAGRRRWRRAPRSRSASPRTARPPRRARSTLNGSEPARSVRAGAGPSQRPVAAAACAGGAPTVGMPSDTPAVRGVRPASKASPARVRRCDSGAPSALRWCGAA